MNGQCTCGACRFRVTARPVVVHACHCTWCQRETGSAFAMNAVVETTAITLLAGEPVETRLPSASGKGQLVLRCGACGVTLWSHYSGSGRAMAFVRVGVLEPGHGLEPDVHIFTATRQPWVPLPEGARTFAEFYVPAEVWGPEGVARVTAARAALA